MLSASSTSTSSLRCSRQRTPFQTKAMERHTVYAAAMGAGRNTLRNALPATRLTIFS